MIEKLVKYKHIFISLFIFGTLCLYFNYMFVYNINLLYIYVSILFIN